MSTDVRYVDWVQVVLRSVLEAEGGPVSFGAPQIAARMGLDIGGWGDEKYRDIQLALVVACEDLGEIDLLEITSMPYHISATTRARRFRQRSLQELWPQLRAGHLEPDEESYLRTLAHLSEEQEEDWAAAQWVPSGQVFDALGWPWDHYRSRAILNVLHEGLFADAHMPLGEGHEVRIKYAGAVWAVDEAGAALSEARDHLGAERVRAAGCIAGVELERRLKHVCRSRDVTVASKLPGIADFNDALRRERIYTQPTWRKIQHLADLRNKCAHVLDDGEPTVEEGQELLEGIEDVLRRIPTD